MLALRLSSLGSAPRLSARPRAAAASVRANLLWAKPDAGEDETPDAGENDGPAAVPVEDGSNVVAVDFKRKK